MSFVMAAVGGGVALTGGIIQSENGKRAAARAGDAANAQAAEAGRQRDAIMGQANENRSRALSLAEASPQELAALERSYKQAGNNLDREQSLLSAIDPAMMEASQQALKLLRGENAGITDAMNMQRKTQRAQLVNQLRAQYGPGAETSSVGMKALQSFDMQSNMMSQQANQGALSQAFGIGTFDAAGRSRSALDQFQNAGHGFSDIQNRKLNAEMNSGNGLLNAMSGTANSMINAAGAPYVQGVQEAQANAALGGSLLNAGTSMGMMGLMQGLNAAKPTPNAPGNGVVDVGGNYGNANTGGVGNLYDSMGGFNFSGGGGGSAMRMPAGGGRSFSTPSFLAQNPGITK